MSKSSSSKSIIKWAVCLLSAIGVIAFVANHNADNQKMKETQSELTSISESATTEMTMQTCSVSTQESHISEVITTATTTTETTETTVETTETADIEVTEATSYTTSEATCTTTQKLIVTTVATTTKSKTTTQKDATPLPSGKNGLTCLGTFKGTYYAGKTAPCKGGSGRTLINCSTSSSGVKGSVASRYVYSKYGYKKCGRTKVWIECSGMPSMAGWYYVDDCCGANNVIDFYYYRNSNCPFRKSGVISVKVYI